MRDGQWERDECCQGDEERIAIENCRTVEFDCRASLDFANRCSDSSDGRGNHRRRVEEHERGWREDRSWRNLEKYRSEGSGKDKEELDGGIEFADEDPVAESRTVAREEEAKGGEGGRKWRDCHCD